VEARPAREVDDEFTHHLELLTREGMARGLSREDALTKARERFGASETLRRSAKALAGTRDRRVGASRTGRRPTR
jgi:hypothetical protein